MCCHWTSKCQLSRPLNPLSVPFTWPKPFAKEGLGFSRSLDKFALSISCINAGLYYANLALEKKKSSLLSWKIIKIPEFDPKRICLFLCVWYKHVWRHSLPVYIGERPWRPCVCCCWSWWPSSLPLKMCCSFAMAAWCNSLCSDTIKMLT